MGAGGTRTSGQANSEEKVGLDWTHPPEAGIQHHTPNPKLEPKGEEEERPASQQLEAELKRQGEQQEQPRTECAGEESSMAYAPQGATGLSK